MREKKRNWQVALPIGFSHIFLGEYILKQKVLVIVQTPAWKFKANIARNMPHFKGVRIKSLPAQIGSKIAAKN